MPDQVVEIVVDDGEAAVARGAHGLGDVLGVDRDGEIGHVDSRRHDLADVHVAQVGQCLDDDALLLGAFGVEGRVRRPFAGPRRPQRFGDSDAGPSGGLGLGVSPDGASRRTAVRACGRSPPGAGVSPPTRTGTG